MLNKLDELSNDPQKCIDVIIHTLKIQVMSLD